LLRILVEGDLILKNQKYCVVLGTQFPGLDSISRPTRAAKKILVVGVKRGLIGRQPQPENFLLFVFAAGGFSGA